jgi:hypothetical protein
MAKFENLNDIIQSLLEPVPLIDIYFSKCELNLNWTPEALANFKTSVRTMFSSELCPLIKEKFPLFTLDNEIFDLPFTIEGCLIRLLDPDISDSDRYTFESYMYSKFIISELIKANQNSQNHSVFNNRVFFNKLVQVMLNHEIQTILSDSGNIVMNHDDLKEKLRNSWNKLFVLALILLPLLPRTIILKEFALLQAKVYSLI